ncbi:TetR/AcrR family transcriptional regulator [Actinomyces sp. 2119]|uniref:TetR/AcrR family transcriptional regulator n=1 Tax=Actinomyces sp. 2119 TaxID=2321393 RepID=UPI000E6BE262|nr:TetR/AcrR family transcriptional regulator [Actinomyces sp. 2119]RJF41199.1 TetR/AcrR family transcriptional regulator [Actinomyces sp. 2119]
MSDPARLGARAVSESARRRVRADARRNRERILVVAEQVFAREGLEAPMDVIAKGAGVGAGTLYRHFPTKQDLLSEILEARFTDLARRRQEIEAAAGSSGEALEQWLEAVGEWMRAYDGLPQPLRDAYVSGSSPLSPTCEEVIEMTRGFLEAAQREGVARADVDAATLYQAALASAWVAGAVEGAQRGAEDGAARGDGTVGRCDTAGPGQGAGGGVASGSGRAAEGAAAQQRLVSLMRRGWQEAR